MPDSARTAYHHGDLRSTLLVTAMAMLEGGEAFSLRAVARRAGVSPAAPYRHFTDRESLESALAAEGLRDLQAALTGAGRPPSSVADLADLAVVYVEFALRRPALFRLMFGHECDDSNDERVRAAAELHDLLAAAMGAVFGDADADALATAGWSMAHGLAFLHLDGKLSSASRAEVAARVRSSFRAAFTAGRPAAPTPRKRAATRAR